MPDPIETRIRRVASSLLPETAFEGEYSGPAPLADRMHFYHTPGVSLAIIDNFEVAWAGGVGVCRAGNDRPVDQRTLFQAGSISKAVFALAVMRLVEQGQLDLDEDISRYLTDWQIPGRDGWRPHLTLRRLLSHSAGVTVVGFPGYPAGAPVPSLVQVLNGEPPANTPLILANTLPGLQYRYSGGGFTLAQQVFTDVLGEPFPDSLQRLVFDPLGLHDSTYQQPLPPGRAEQAATAHIYTGLPLPGGWHTYPEMAAAGLWTTPADLATIGVELLQVLHGQKAPALIQRETIEAMLQPQLPGQIAGQDYYVGLGFFCGGQGQDFWFGHRGSDEGFVSVMQVYKHLGKGFAVMVNSNEYGLRDEIVRAIAREFDLPDVFPPEKLAGSVAPGDLAAFAGAYLATAGASFTITAADSGLALSFAGQPPLRLYPASEMEFFARALNLSVTFERDRQGRVTALTLTQEGQPFRAEKSS
jgi:CubicO group peptidase (beta-lactamase class C family)